MLDTVQFATNATVQRLDQPRDNHATDEEPEMNTTSYDVIVAGVGAHGSAALWHLARRGVRVLGLEQFELGHGLGSSHGETRVFRFAYNEGAFYVPMMRAAFAHWQDLDRRCADTLVHITGTLEMAPVGEGTVERCVAACQAYDLSYEVLGAAEIKARYPAFDLPPGYHGIWQPEGGFILCERGMAALQAEAIAAGAEIKAGEGMIDWTPRAGGGVEVRTAKATYTAGQLVLTCGGWAGLHAPVLAPHLKTVRQGVAWFEPVDPEPLRLGRLPVFMVASDVGDFYGFPIHSDRGFKIGGPHFAREAIDVHDTARTPSPRQLALIQTFLPQYMPIAAGRLLETQGCVYTVTPDEHFVLDRLPACDQVVVVSACSGHGFKFAPVIGEIAADLATGRTPRFDMTPFRIDRFTGC
jgi:sarcosine oxidase